MITREKARKLRAVIERSVAAIELEPGEALEVIELFPAWEPDKAYTAGTRVQHGGRLYECATAHTSAAEWSPPAAASLWSAVKVDEETGLDEWTRPTGAHNAYNKGDKVVYKGSVYESVIDGNTWSPEEYPAGWTLKA